MKTIKTLLLVLAITFTSVLSANTNPTHAEPDVLTKEIATLLKNPKFRVAEDLVANVTFILNEDQEIVVLNVDTKSEVLESFIKSRLNYNKLDGNINSVNKTFEVPVRITAQ